MADLRHMAEFAERRQRPERLGAVAAGRRVAVRPVEIEYLVQPGLDLVPGLVAAFGNVHPKRNRRDVAGHRIVAVRLQRLQVLVMAATGAGRHAVAAPRRPGDALLTHSRYQYWRTGPL